MTTRTTRTTRTFALALVAFGLALAVVAPPAAAVPGPTLPYTWIRQWGGGEVSVQGVAALPDGGVVVAGTGRWYQAFVRAYNSDGSLRWNTTWDVPTDAAADDFNSIEGEKVRDVAVDLGGNVYVVGNTRHPMPGIASVAANTELGFIVKLDPSGNRVWTQEVDGGNGTSSGLKDVAVSKAGDLYVVGYSGGTIPGALNTVPAGGNVLPTFAARYRSTGARSWVRWVTGDTFGPWGSIAVDAGGRVFVAGGTRSPADSGGLTFANVTAYVRMLDPDGGLPSTGLSLQPSDSGYSQVYDVAVDASGRVTAVGAAAGRMQGAPAGAKGGFTMTFRPDLSRYPTTVQGAISSEDHQSVAIDGRGRRSVLGFSDLDSPGAGLGNGDLRRVGLPAAGQPGSGSSRLIGTTFDEYPEGMGSAYAPKGGAYYDAAAGRGPYQGTDSTVNQNGFLGGVPSGNPAPWYPYATPTAAVKDLAARFLGVQMDPSFTAAYAESLGSTSSVPGVIIALLRGSNDNTTKVDPVTRLYRAYFLRSPDLSGFDHWVGKIRGGTTLAKISATFAASSEFTNRYGTLTNRQFVEKVYQNVLYRTGDPGGITYWTNKLTNGSISRGAVMTNFSESSEGIRLNRAYVDADVAYLQLADRPPTPTELNDWASWVANTPTPLLYGLVFQDVKQAS